MLTILIPVAAVALVVILGVLAFQPGREGLDLSPQTLLRGYLYLGAFAGIVALALGLAALLNGGLATALGNDVIYGMPPSARPCPPNADCSQAFLTPVLPELDRRRQEDLLRGLTFTVFGSLFYAAHRAARGSVYARGVEVADHGGLHRAYLLLGTIVFGISTIALLPAGFYQLLANAIVSTPPEVFRPGVSDSLAGGIVSFAIWLLFLRAVLRDARGGGPAPVHHTGRGGGPAPNHRAGPSTPPAEPAPVGAPIGPRPWERSAGAEAEPPRERG